MCSGFFPFCHNHVFVSLSIPAGKARPGLFTLGKPYETSKDMSEARLVRPYQGLLVLLYYEGLLAKCVTLVSSCFRITCEFQKQSPSWNFLVSREELFGSNGGTIRGKGIRKRIVCK